MKQLFFKKEYMQLIKAGKKTSTMRVYAQFKPDDEVLFMSGNDRIKAKIQSIQKVQLKEVTSDMAKNDGFKSRADLISALEQIYPNDSLNELFYIKFVTI